MALFSNASRDASRDEMNVSIIGILKELNSRLRLERLSRPPWNTSRGLPECICEAAASNQLYELLALQDQQANLMFD
jgi:hypothetical protein